MEIRRRLLMQDSNKCPYITDGLVLWMDGIENGNVTGAWVDQIAGHVFQGVNDPEMLDNCVKLNGTNQYFQCTTFAEYPKVGNATIEVCDDISNQSLIYMPSTNDQIAYGYYNRGAIWCTVSSITRQLIPVPAPHIGTVSVTDGLCVSNGAPVSFMENADFWAGADGTAYIGCRQGRVRFAQGKIYAIRIYNRHLTADEMIHNQRIDNKRFKLGLEI
jgi:hypothetical protein